MKVNRRHQCRIHRQDRKTLRLHHYRLPQIRNKNLDQEYLTLKECIEKNIPEEQAVEKLIELIRSNGDYIEK